MKYSLRLITKLYLILSHTFMLYELYFGPPKKISVTKKKKENPFLYIRHILFGILLTEQI